MQFGIINIDLESFVMRYNAFFLPINLLDQCFRKNWIDIVERIIEWKKKKEKKGVKFERNQLMQFEH